MPFSKIAAGGLLFSAVLSIASPALAQSDPPPAGAEDESALPDTSELHIPGYGNSSRSTWIDFEVAPELASHNPLGSSSRTSDETSVSLTFITVQPISRELEIEFDVGPSTTIDTDNDNSFSSSLAAGLELRTRASAAGISSFVSYGVARDYDDFFGEGLDTSQTLKTGVRYGGNLGPMQVGVEVAPRYVNSTQDLDDYIAAELWMEGVVPVFGDGIDLIGEAIIDRRWYQNSDPGFGTARRDWRFETFLGLDFAGAVLPGDNSPLRSLGVGVRWLDINSNFNSIDSSSLKLLPAVTLRLRL
jgi:hypothetical protein